MAPVLAVGRAGYFYPRSPCGERLWLQLFLYYQDNNFYPRSPCGERHRTATSRRPIFFISIHALLAESDHKTRRQSPCQNRISIHALLAESDVNKIPNQRQIDQFLSTLSLRRATSDKVPLAESTAISIHALLAESDLPINVMSVSAVQISIHALLAESDLRVVDGSKSSIQISIHALLAESDAYIMTTTTCTV